MISIFKFVFRIPFWVFFILGFAVIGAGVYALHLTQLENDKIAVALASEPPQRVDFTSQTNIGSGEVLLRAQIDDFYSYEYHYETDGGEPYVEYYYFLREPNATAEASDFAAVVILETDQRDELAAWVNKAIVGEGKLGPILELNGWARPLDVLGSDVGEILGYFGMTKASNFTYIRPFLNSREEGLRAAIIPVELVTIVTGILSIAAFLAGIIVLVVSRFVSPAPRKSPAGAKKLVGAGAALMFGDDEVEDAEESDDEFGVLKPVLTIVGFLWKRRAAKKNVQTSVAPQTQPSRQSWLARLRENRRINAFAKQQRRVDPFDRFYMQVQAETGH